MGVVMEDGFDMCIVEAASDGGEFEGAQGFQADECESKLWVTGEFGGIDQVVIEP
ncbi:unnamed protein product [marine sediment metagenome]|uniref:Uncharacterized protein n=1 Tax=marine sediment metagenome TaxID=412755 RepID=X0U393_9ZZZZ